MKTEDPGKMEEVPRLKVDIKIKRGKDGVSLEVTHPHNDKVARINAKKKDKPRAIRWKANTLEPGEMLTIYCKPAQKAPNEEPKAVLTQPGEGVFDDHYKIVHPETSVSTGEVVIRGGDDTYGWCYGITLYRKTGAPVTLDPWVIIQKP